MLDGGNAVDAAVAVLFCIGLAHPESAGIGGGFLMTIYNSTSRQARCLNAREVAPIKSSENMFGGNATRSQTGSDVFFKISYLNPDHKSSNFKENKIMNN